MVIKKYNNYSFINIKLNNLDIILCDLGASIYSIKFNDEIMTLTPSNKDEFLSENIYHGKTIGRVANRLPGNKVIIGKKIYELENNEGPNTLHGGKAAISAQKFEYEVEEKNDSVEVTFTYLDKEKIKGFPGNLYLSVKYLIKDDSILITYISTTDKLTMCSLTNHAYYSLGTNSLDEVELQINSSRYLHPNPNDLLPLEICRVDKVMDFRKSHIITDYIDDSYLINSKTKGYDHYYYFDNVDSNIPQILLKSKKYKMSVFSDFSGTQIYTDNYLMNEQFLQSNKKIHRGIAIEPSESQKDIHLLDKNEIYSHFIKLKFDIIQ